MRDYLPIAGIVKTSFIDYSPLISSVLFLKNCNFKCPFCYNKHAVFGSSIELSINELITFLKERKKFVEGICISGGEPTIHSELKDIIKIIKGMDYKVKLDTNGTNPKVIKELLRDELIDYIAVDIKHTFDKYDELTNVISPIENIKETIDILSKCEIDYEYRTTVIKKIHTKEVLLKIANEIKNAPKWYLQPFTPNENIIDETFNKYGKTPISYLKEIQITLNEIVTTLVRDY